MAKHKKTLEQKKQADIRRDMHALPLYEFQAPTAAKVVPATFSLHASLTHDLRKTLLLSMAIALFLMLFAFLLSRHLLQVPGSIIGY